MLAPCDVISQIKQNSSDMNEIILAPCDAGYVQSCTGFRMFCDFLDVLLSIQLLRPELYLVFFLLFIDYGPCTIFY
jgi:hypothetical protein